MIEQIKMLERCFSQDASDRVEPKDPLKELMAGVIAEVIKEPIPEEWSV